MGDIAFTCSGTEYTITEFVAYTGSTTLRQFCIRTTPSRISAANLMALEVTVGDRTFIDDDTTTDDDRVLQGGGDVCRARDYADGTDWNLAKDTTVTVVIESPTSDGPDAPTGFTASASDATSVKRAWDDPSDSDITKYQYRRKAGSGSYGNWTDMGGSGSSTTSYIVTGLTHGTEYTFQVRAYTTARGSSSVERSATGGGQSALWNDRRLQSFAGADSSGGAFHANTLNMDTRRSYNVLRDSGLKIQPWASQRTAALSRQLSLGVELAGPWTLQLAATRDSAPMLSAASLATSPANVSRSVSSNATAELGLPDPVPDDSAGEPAARAGAGRERCQDGSAERIRLTCDTATSSSNSRRSSGLKPPSRDRGPRPDRR